MPLMKFLIDGLRAEADADGQRATHESEDGQRNAREIQDADDQGQPQQNHRPAAQH